MTARPTRAQAISKRARELYNGSLSGKVRSLETAYEYWAQALYEAEQRGREVGSAYLQAQLGAHKRALSDLQQEKGFALSEYEAKALKRLLEQTGCAQRWKIKHLDGYHLCDGDWGHQIYAKLLAMLDGGDDEAK